jgi:myo-inositol-1(or 4)-monophosphatase
MITTWDGGPPQAGGRIVAAGDRRVHDAAREKLMTEDGGRMTEDG